MLKLKYERLNRGFTQLELAELLQVTPEYIHYLETGKRHPSWKTQKRLENLFGIPASELLAEEEEKQVSR